MLYPRLGRAIVLVKEDQLSLAIGRRGQNVRLASKLVGWDIEIMTHDELNTGIEKAESWFTGLPHVTGEMVEAFIEEGFLSYTDLTFVEPAELAELGGVTEEQAEEIIAFAEEEAEKQEEEARLAKPETPAPTASAPQSAAAKAAKLFSGPLGETAAAAPSEAKQTFESLFGPAQEEAPAAPAEPGEAENAEQAPTAEDYGSAPAATEEEQQTPAEPVAEHTEESLHEHTEELPSGEQVNPAPVDSGSPE